MTALTSPPAHGVLVVGRGTALPTTTISIAGSSVVTSCGLSATDSWEAVRRDRARNPIGFLYRWTLGSGRPSPISGFDRFSAATLGAGTYTLTVTAMPGYGTPGDLRRQLHSSRNITVLRCVRISEFSAVPVALGGDATFKVSVTGTPPVYIRAVFDDGSQRRWTIFRDPWTFRFERRYAEIGSKHASLKASNAASWTSASAVVVVQEPVSGLSVRLLSPTSPVPLLRAVVVEATVESGTGLRFRWDFGEGEMHEQDTQVQSRGRTSVARHVYGIASTYSVTVSVSNVLSQHNLTARLEPPVTVVEDIDKLRAEVVGGRYVVLLHDCDGSVSDHQPFDEAVSPTAYQHGSWSSSASTARNDDVSGTSTIVGDSSPTSVECETSDEVLFEAWVWRGSDVVFVFDFGDGHIERVDAVLNERSMPTAIVAHRYTRGGAFGVSVTASNPLGNVSCVIDRRLHVQRSPRGLSLDRPYYVARVGSALTFGAALDRGTDVSVSWTLSDGVLATGRTGWNFTHLFDRPGTFDLFAEASNLVARELSLPRPNATAKVHVQEPLQDMDLCLLLSEGEVCAPADLTLPLEDKMMLRATAQPETEKMVRFLWSIGSEEVYATYDGHILLGLDHPGTYLVNATCQNHVSYVSSAPLRLDLVQRVGNVTGIRHSGSVLVGRVSRFQVLFWFGSNLTFLWDFGDGSPATLDAVPHAEHVYNRTGKYKVRVTLQNAYSRAEFETNVFVLEKPCDQPVISMYSVEEARYDQDIHIETGVSTSCSASNKVKYSWTIWKRSSTGMIVVPIPVIRLGKDLHLPARSLLPGEYVVSLKAEMLNSVVYKTENLTFHIIKPPVKVLIQGGIWRMIATSMNASLEANFSADIDWSQLSWECSRLGSNSPCFEGMSPFLPATNKSTLTFPTSYLHGHLGTYLFRSTMSHDSSSTSAEVVLDMSHGFSHARTFYITCESCDGHSVNAEKKLLLQAACIDCGTDSDFEYAWKLWHVLDGNHRFLLGDGRCVEPDGTTFLLLSKDTKNAKEPSENSPPDVKEEKGDVFPPFPAILGFTDEQTRLQKGYYGGFGFLASEEESSKVFPILLSSSEEFDIRKNSSFIFGRQSYLDDIKEGPTGELGSARARNQRIYFSRPFYGTERSRLGALNVHQRKQPASLGLLQARRVRSTGEASPKYVSKVLQTMRYPRVMVDIGPSVSTRSPPHWLTLHPGVLRVGSTYLAQVSIFRKGTSALLGETMQRLEVAIGPLNGRCTVTPTSGVALETVFRLHCMEWKGAHPPYLYELSYSLTPDGPNKIVYNGFRPCIRFWLPPGWNSQRGIVYLKVVVRDSSGVGTQVCSIETEVAAPRLNTSLANYLRNITLHPRSKLAQLIGEQNHQAALNRIHVILHMLKNVRAVGNHPNRSGTTVKKRIFKFTLKTLHYVHLFDSFATKSLLLTLGVVLEPPFQGEDSDLGGAAKLLQSIVQFPRPTTAIYKFFAPTTTEIINIMGTLMKLAQEAGRHDWQFLLMCSLTLRLTLKVSLQEDSAPNKAIQFSSQWVSVASICSSARMSPLRIHSEWNTVTLPPVSSDDHRRFTDRSRNCDITSMYSFPYMPFKAPPSSLAYPVPHTSVFTVILNRVNSVSQKDWITLLFKRTPANNRVNKAMKSSFLLQPGLANKHLLNVTRTLLGYSLYIKLSFRQPPGPLGIHLSSGGYIEDVNGARVIVQDNGNVEIFVPERTITALGTYYLIIAQKPQIKKRWKVTYGEMDIPYDIKGFWQRCMQYIPDDHQWNTTGCFVRSSTNEKYVHCQCTGSTVVTMNTIPLHPNVTKVHTQSLFARPVNGPVIMFVLVSFLAYGVLVGLFHKNQQSSHKSRHIVSLEPCVSTAHHLYLVIVRTGPYFCAGTSAMVSLRLHGENEMSTPKELLDPNGGSQLFQRGSSDAFLISTGKGLGKLWKLEVWHNNAGLSPSWFLQDISVMDLQTEVVSHFSFNQWLSVSDGDGTIGKEIPVSPAEQSLLKELTNNLLSAFSEHHLWSSVLAAPRCSLFSRIQRLTVCLSTVFSSSALCTLWVCFVVPEPSTQNIITGISVWRILHAIGFSLVVHAVHQVPAVIFRNSTCTIIPTKVLAQCWQLVNRIPGSICRVGKNSSRSAGSTIEGSTTNFDDGDETNSLSSYESMSLYGTSLNAETEKGSEALDSSFYSRSPLSPLEATLVQWQDIEVWARRKREQIHHLVHSISQLSLHHTLQGPQEKCLATGDTSVRSPGPSGSGYLPEMACRVPSLEDSCVALPSWVGLIGWLVEAGVIVCSVYALIAYSEMFRVLSNILCFELIILTILSSVFLVYPLQVLVISLYFTVQSCLRPFGAFVVLRCRCDAALRRLVKDLCGSTKKREAGSRPNFHALEPRGSAALNYLRHPSEHSLIQARKRFLLTAEATEALRYCTVCLMFMAVLLMAAFCGTSELHYRQHKSIANLFRRPDHVSKQSMKDNVLFLTQSVLPLLGGNESVKLLLQTGSYRIVPFKLFLAREFPDELQHNCQHSCGKNGCFDNFCRTSLERLQKEHLGTIRGVMLQFELYNPALEFISAGTFTIEANVGIHAHLKLHICRVHHAALTHGNLIKVLILLMILCNFKTLIWKSMKGKWMAYLQFWNLMEVIFCITGLCYIACCLAEFVALENLLGHMHHKRMNIFEFSLVLAMWQHISRTLLGFLIFINTLNLLRVFYIIQQSWMFQFISIISRVWKEAVCLCVCWMVILGSGSFLSQAKFRTGVVHLTTTIFRGIASSFGLVSQVTMVYPWNHVGELLQIGTWIIGTTVTFAAVKALNIQQKKVFKHRSIDGMNIRLLVMGLKERLSILFGKSIYGQVPSGDCRKLHGEFLLFELEKLMDELMRKTDQLFPQCSIDALTESTLACNPNGAPLNEDGGASSSSLSHPIFEGCDLLKTGNGGRNSSPNSIYFASSSEKSLEHRHDEHRSAFHRRRRVLDLHRTALKVSKKSLAQMSKQSLRQKTTAIRGSLSELSSSSSSSLQRARRQNERLAHFRQLRTKSREKVHNGNVRTVWDDRVLAYLKG